MTYEEALAFWYGRINYEQRSPEPGDLKLDRIRALMALLGNPQQRLRIVHVAGSKGKGSTSAMLASVLQRAGYRTGLFTSPHLVRVEERMQVNGLAISPDELAKLMEVVKPAVETLDAKAKTAGDRPTFFEIVTALAFLHFVQRRVEVAVFEVGLGGRFDSTNICQPLIAVITSISYDHQQQLGNTLARIAGEKAGIIKPGVPTVSGATVPEARQVIEAICRERQSPLVQIGREVTFRYQPGTIQQRLALNGDGLTGLQPEEKPLVSFQTKRQTWPDIPLGLLGEHQAANAAVVVACIEELRRRGLPIADTAVVAGLAGVHWPARLEIVGRRPLVVLDCAHNLASARALADTLTASFPVARRSLIFAGSADKDLGGMLRLLTPLFAHIYLTRYTLNPRAALPEELVRLLPAEARSTCTLCATPVEAWRLARGAAAPDELICITGSVFLAGEMRPVIVS